MMKTFETHESEVRGYIRSFPAVFTRAAGHELFSEQGNRYIDLFSGAGALAYGHNPPALSERLLDYLRSGGVMHSLDMATTAKREFIEAVQEIVLEPRGLSYKMLFSGPTGTNAVEAAMKVARKATRRRPVYCFEGGFHGMTLGSLSVTSNPGKRAGAGTELHDARRLPFEGDTVNGRDSLEVVKRAFAEDAERNRLPAAIIVETVQCEGGVRTASDTWLQAIARIAREHGTLLIVDDIQAGCGRTGDFFSFERAGLTPDIVCLSKALSGIGLPLALVLLRPELDVLRPGEHNGTFRGNNAAFVTATTALREFWRDDRLTNTVRTRAARIHERLSAIAEEHAPGASEVRGRGMVQGIHFEDASIANEISRDAFEHGLIIETAGHQDEVIKLLPRLDIPEDALEEALDILEASVARATAGDAVGARA